MYYEQISIVGVRVLLFGLDIYHRRWRHQMEFGANLLKLLRKTASINSDITQRVSLIK